MIDGLAHSPVKTRAQSEFLFESVRARAGRFPYRCETPSALEHMVRREMVQGATARYVHPEATPENMMGCFVIRPKQVIWAYMKEPYQQQGIMTTILEEYGITFEAVPIPVTVWSAVASRIAEKGYRIYPMVPPTRARERA